MSHTAYNGLGRPVSATLPVGVTSTRTGDFTVPATNRITRTTYLADPLMRAKTVTAPGQSASSSLRYGKGDLTRVSHDNRYETVTDELGRRVASHFDRWGQLAAAIADSGGTDETTTRFAYDGLGRLVKSTAPMGDVTTYAYDVHGDMTSRTQPDAGTTSYKYDSRHNVRFSQNAQQASGGKVSYFTYDKFSRMTRSGEVTRAFSSLDANQAYPFETDAVSWTSRYIYDVDDAGGAGAKATYPVGRPTRIEQNTDADAAAEVIAHIAYDHEGRVVHRRVSIDTLPAKDVYYRYDLAGKVTAMVYPDGTEARYAYDSAGRLAGVTDAGGNALAVYAYDHDGRMATHTVGGTLATGAYRYNTRDWVTGIDYPGRFTLSQAYDAVGNVTSQHYRRAATETRKAASYTYDGLHRLKTFRLGSTHARSYAYDDNGNITRVVTGSDTATYAYSRASTPNRLDRITEGTKIDRFRYDANGSATSLAGVALTYEHRGLVTGYGAYGYTLDAEGYRVKKTGGGSTVYYVRGAGGSVLATYDAGGNLTANYLYAGGDRLARVAGGAVSYYLKDHLGSTRTLLSSGGTVAATYDYWPYGEVLATGGTDATPFRFTGHERDAESGLDFMPNRTYGPVARRFWQVDPMAQKYPELSPYTYTAGNPLKYWDPDGRSHHDPQDQYDPNQIVQDRFDEGGVEVANAIANLPVYVQSGAEKSVDVVADYALNLAETSVNSGIVISDALSEGSIAGAAAGTVGVGVGIATRNPALAAGSVKFTYTMLSINTGANVASTVLKSVDAASFDGSKEAAYSQAVRLVLGSGGSKVLGMVGGRFVAATSSSVVGTFYRSSTTGQFVSNRMGFASTAAVDATSVGINFSLDTLIDP